MLAKLGSKLLNNPDIIWVQVVATKYLSKGKFFILNWQELPPYGDKF